MELFKKICRLAGTAQERYRMIGDGDRILVALSGGKDSMVLMHLLDHWRGHAPVRFEFAAATFDPGYEEFNCAAISDYCAAHGWKHFIVKLAMAPLIEEKGFGDSPCVLCSRLRRGKLYGLAREHGFNKLALGQHLDDVIGSFLISLCRGQGLTTMAPHTAALDPQEPEIIRPLALVPEQLIAAYSATLGLPRAGVCRYKEQLRSGDRAYFGALVDALEKRIPDIRANIAKSLSHVETEHLLVVSEEDSGHVV